MKDQPGTKLIRPVLIASGMLAGVLFTAFALDSLYLGWAWSFLLWAVLLVAMARVARHTIAYSMTLIYLSAVCLALGLAEFWFAPSWSAPADVYTGDYMGDYFVDHDVLGYGPQPGLAATSNRTIDGEFIYSTVYTINAHGRRVTPVSKADRSALFFGGSFTFGEGVQDEESMPYQLAERVGNEPAIHNFGFHGYGPHQMLAALESGLVAESINQPVDYVIYQTIPDHVHRAVGRAFWDKSGPRFQLQPDGSATFSGRFDDGKGVIGKWLDQRLQKSQLYQRLFGLQKTISEDDVALYLAIISGARQFVAENYPGAEFHVLLWGYPGAAEYDAIVAGLASAGIPVHRIIDILPGYDVEPQRYELHVKDTHPNARAHELIADYVATEIVR